MAGLAMLLSLPSIIHAAEPARTATPRELRTSWTPTAALHARHAPLAIVNGLEGCLRVNYTVTAEGATADIRISHEDVEFRGPRMSGQRVAARVRAQAVQAQKDALVAAVAALRHEPTAANPGRAPVRVSLPAVYVAQNFPDPGDAAAVGREVARAGERRAAIAARCDAAAGSGSG